jgi:hypothetical protein
MMQKNSHGRACVMPAIAAERRVSVRTRILAYALLGYVVLMVLFGASVAELGLEALGCPGRPGSSETGCQGLAMLPAQGLVPWLSVTPPLETTFLLLEEAWLLMAGWVGLIVLSVRSDRRPKPPVDTQHEALVVSEQSAIASSGNTSYAAQQAEWIRHKQAEQAQEREAEQLSLYRRLQVEGALWGSLSIVFIFMLGGLAVFCLALGTPLIGGLSAQSLLHTFGCANQSLMASNPLGGFCGFWTDRLEPYQRPWFGALFSPVWLFTQFSDVLLIWMALILLLALMFVYRVGWLMVFKNSSPYLKAIGLIMFSAALLGQLYQMTRETSQLVQSFSSSGLSPAVNVVEMVVLAGTVIVLVVIAGLIALIVLAINLTREFTRRRAQARAVKTTPAKAKPLSL